ncbi:hypothetical protein SLA2020_419770 [Shorea laevis]
MTSNSVINWKSWVGLEFGFTVGFRWYLKQDSCERVSKDDALLPISNKELRSGVVEMAVNSMKEEEERRRIRLQ